MSAIFDDVTGRESALTDAMIAQYRRDGWVKISAGISAADMALIQRVMARAEKELVEPARIDLAKEGTAHPDQEAAQSTTYLENLRRMFRNDIDVRLAYPELNPVIARLSKFASRLVGGSGEVRIFQDQTFVKPPAGEGGLPTTWHQDLCYFPLDRKGLMSFWIPLQDVGPETGSLCFLPRSQRLGPLGRIVFEKDKLNEILMPEDRALIGEPVAETLKVGDFTAHDGLMLHSAGANNGSKPRAAWTVLFIPAETRWTGAPCGYKRLNNAGLSLLGHFDDASFQITESVS